MQFTTLLIAALSASTLTTALPTLNSTDPFAYDDVSESGLEKRGTFGWLSSFAMGGTSLLFPFPSPSHPANSMSLSPAQETFYQSVLIGE